MSQKTLGIKPTIIDLIFGQNLVSSASYVAAGAAFTALAAQFVVPIFPVPITAQTLAVLLVGFSLGALRGVLAMLLYAALGLIGLPVFSETTAGTEILLGSSGGYILGFVVSAGVAGLFAEKHWDQTFIRAAVAATAATALTFLFGMIGLGVAMRDLGQNSSIPALLGAGVLPFLIGAVIKILLAAAILSLSWKAVQRHEPSEPASR